MDAQASILDQDVESEIKEILMMCGTHKASVSIRYTQAGTKDRLWEHELRTFSITGGTGKPEYRATPDAEQVFHIASVTKLLVAVAVFIAIEVRAKDNVPNNPYAKFRDIQNEPIARVYNRYSNAKISGLPGNPTIYNLIVHYMGIRSANHRQLAPDGTPITNLADIGQDLISPVTHDTAGVYTKKSWTEYSNVNYGVIAMTIEALWGRGLDSFMRETLFKYLNMDSTSIGFPEGKKDGLNSWVVDADENPHSLPVIRYQEDGAEAGALGAYSTAQDMDAFFKFLLDTFHETNTIPGFDLLVLAKILKMVNRYTDEIRFTGLGIFTTLDSSVIGLQSSNRLQFPDEDFYTYPVLSGSLGEGLGTYHMVGSGIGCSCATAFYPSPNQGNHAIVVLTDTSGPVVSADHILKLLLRRVAEVQRSDKILPPHWQLKIVKEMVNQAKKKTMEQWKKSLQNDHLLREKAPKINKDILGTFKGQGFSQKLYISVSDSGHTKICIGGSSTPVRSSSFDLIWVNENSVKICVPPHLSIDCLGNGDWSNLYFTVQNSGPRVTKLTRETASGLDHYLRIL